MAKRRRCEFCGDTLPADARPNRKFCDDDCRKSRTRAPEPETTLGEISAGTETAIAEAYKEKRLGPMDAGAVAAIRVLARKIDEAEARWRYCLEFAQWAKENGATPPKPPPMDTVSMPVYLNYCNALGLAPAGRAGLPGPKEAGRASKLGGHLSAVKKPGA